MKKLNNASHKEPQKAQNRLPTRMRVLVLPKPIFNVLLLNACDKKTCYFAGKVNWHGACSIGSSFAELGGQKREE